MMKIFAVLPANRLTSQRVGVPFTAWMGWEADHHFWVALRGRQALTNIFHDGRGQTDLIIAFRSVGRRGERKAIEIQKGSGEDEHTPKSHAMHAWDGWALSLGGWMAFIYPHYYR